MSAVNNVLLKKNINHNKVQEVTTLLTKGNNKKPKHISSVDATEKNYMLKEMFKT